MASFSFTITVDNANVTPYFEAWQKLRPKNEGETNSQYLNRTIGEVIINEIHEGLIIIAKQDAVENTPPPDVTIT